MERQVPSQTSERYQGAYLHFILIGMSMFTKRFTGGCKSYFLRNMISKVNPDSELPSRILVLVHSSLSVLRITLPFTQTLIFKPGPCASSGCSVHNLAHLPSLSGYIHTFSLLSQEYGNPFPCRDWLFFFLSIAQITHLSMSSHQFNSLKKGIVSVFFYSHLPSVWHIMNSQKTFLSK